MGAGVTVGQKHRQERCRFGVIIQREPALFSEERGLILFFDIEKLHIHELLEHSTPFFLRKGKEK